MVLVAPVPHPSDLPSHAQGYQPPADVEHDVNAITQQWLSTFSKAASTGDGDLFQSLFVKNGYWRDILAFTNDYRSIRTVNIAKAASVCTACGWYHIRILTTQARFPVVKPRNITIGPAAPGFESPFPDITFLSIQFRFETNLGKAFGLTRLVWDVDAWRSFTCFTLLEEIHDHQRKIGENRPRGSHNDKISYDEKREEEQKFTNSSPDVLISKCFDWVQRMMLTILSWWGPQRFGNGRSAQVNGHQCSGCRYAKAGR